MARDTRVRPQRHSSVARERAVAYMPRGPGLAESVDALEASPAALRRRDHPVAVVVPARGAVPEDQVVEVPPAAP